MYRLPADFKPRVFVDLGANIGLTSLWFACRYGCNRIIAIEPSPANAVLARKNLEIEGVDARVVEAAAGRKTAQRFLTPALARQMGALWVRTRRKMPFLPGQYAVRVMSMETILHDLPETNANRFDEIDIEGGEQDLLTGNTDWLSRVSSLIIEFHPALIDYKSLVAVLENTGFRRATMLCTNPQGGNTLELWTRQPVSSETDTPDVIKHFPVAA